MPPPPMTTSSDSITQPAALAALGTFLVAFVAGLAWLAVREARRPWPPRRDLNGHLIKEDEFKDEKVILGNHSTRYSAGVAVNSSDAPGTEGHCLAYTASFSSTTPPSSPSKSIPLFTRTSPPASPTRARTPRSPPRTSSTRVPATTLRNTLTAVSPLRKGLRPLSLASTAAGSPASHASSAFEGGLATAWAATLFGGRMV